MLYTLYFRKSSILSNQRVHFEIMCYHIEIDILDYYQHSSAFFIDFNVKKITLNMIFLFLYYVLLTSD